MISKPSFIAVLLSFASLLVVLAILLIPAPESAWEELEPTSHSKAVIRTTVYYSGPLSSHGEVAQPLKGWRHLMSRSDAPLVFAELATQSSVAGRLWALSALTLADTAAAARLYSELSLDSTVVSFIRGCDPLVDMPAATLAKRAVDRTWVEALRDSVPRCGL